jgi:histidine ammonia-lyase/phenylalanine ammonia-lyase
VLHPEARFRVGESHQRLLTLLQRRTPIYGVTTGFGDSCFRFIEAEKAYELQANLVEYLLCGTGPMMPIEASRAMFAVRAQSMARGFSGVTVELVERMRLFLERDWIPAVPREGSLGASGDLIPLAYLARVLQGGGDVFAPEFGGRVVPLANILEQQGISPYKLQPKEGLALVNGTSAMAGYALTVLQTLDFFVELSAILSAWQCMVLHGKIEAFGTLVNEIAKTNPGQKHIAAQVRATLEAENYSSVRGQDVHVAHGLTQGYVQDRYSLRCVPQILGPIWDNLQQSWSFLEHEINSVTDNPLIDEAGHLEMGGNFYGGYMCQAMDFTKIHFAHMADLIDRQVLMLVDEKSNRGLPPNLANWPGIADEDRHLHHGLKGLHQSASAITSEIIAKSMPNGVFSRSSESHNQDKVSLGMSAASQAYDMIAPLATLFSLQMVCLAQALDLRGIQLRGEKSREVYGWIRGEVPFIKKDTSLGLQITKIASKLRDLAYGR